MIKVLSISIVNCYPVLWHKQYKRPRELNIWKKSVFQNLALNTNYISRLNYISAQESFALYNNENINCKIFINHIIVLSYYTEWGRESKLTASYRYYSYKCPPFSISPLAQIVLAIEKWSQMMLFFFFPQILELKSFWIALFLLH